MVALETGIDKKNTRRHQPSGSYVEAHHSVRDVKYFVVSEHELEAKDLYDQISSVSFSLGSSLISFGMGLFVAAAFADRLSNVALILSEAIAPLSCFCGLLGFGVGFWFHRMRKAQHKRIEENSRPLASL